MLNETNLNEESRSFYSGRKQVQLRLHSLMKCLPLILLDRSSEALTKGFLVAAVCHQCLLVHPKLLPPLYFMLIFRFLYKPHFLFFLIFVAGGKRKLMIPPMLAYGPEPAGCFSGTMELRANLIASILTLNFVNHVDFFHCTVYSAKLIFRESVV